MVAIAENAIASKRDYDDIMTELDSLTSKLNKTRKALLATQDKLNASEGKSQQLEMHVSELVAARHSETKELRSLRESNAYLKTEEATLRESLDLTKNVFTRTQLKAKEQEETITLLTEERDLLLEENNRLRNMEKKKTTHKNASVLATSLEAARGECSEFRRAQMKSEQTIRKLKNELREMRDLYETEDGSVSKYTVADRKNLLDRLELRVLSLFDRSDRDDEESYFEGSDIATRVMLDEEVANARNFSRNFCAGY